MSKLLKRLLLAVFLGTCLAFLPIILSSALSRDYRADRDSFSPGVMARLTYWPISLLPVVGGLDCPNADEIADKLRCIGIALTVDAITYSALSFALLGWFARRRPTANRVARTD
jgi:hypothetical protein